MTTETLYFTPALLYGDRFIKFGGYNPNNDHMMDSFMISDSIKPNQNSMVNWTIQPEWRLPEPMWGFGYVLYKHYVIISVAVTRGPTAYFVIQYIY